MSIKITSMNFGDCDTILHNTPNGMKNIAEVLGPNGEVYWSSTKELTGIPPLSIRSNGTMLLDYLVSGNMSQSGTPTPDSPIQPSECGDRTGNLFDLSAYYAVDSGITNISIDNGAITYNASSVYLAIRYKFNLSVSDIFTIGLGSDSEKTQIELRYLKNNTQVGQPIVIQKGSYQVISGGDAYDAFSIYISNRANTGTCKASNIMLNLGETALPYENFGYKIPISSGGENLWDGTYTKGFIGTTYIYKNTGTSANCAIIPCEPSTTYTVKKHDESNRFAIGTSNVLPYDEIQLTGIYYLDTATSYTFTTDSSAHYMVVYVSTGMEQAEPRLMVNTGTTALPYEPYNRTTTPIFLGEVESTRRINKLVLTGNENITTEDAVNIRRALIEIEQGGASTPLISTHYGYDYGFIDNTAYVGNTRPNFLYINDNTHAKSDADFKSYLAQQYANGTPVTVWYVLATPTTGIVNEPLRKIGDYADTVSHEQAGMQIPTNRGNTVIDVETTLKPSEMYIKYK